MKRFIVTAWGGDNTHDAEAKALFDRSGLKDGNTFVLMLDPDGKYVHGFRAYATGRRNPTYVEDEIEKGLAKMTLPPFEPKPTETFADLKLPEFKGGVRLYIKPESKPVIVEAVAVSADQRKALRWPAEAGEIDAALLKDWLVQVYPSAIRAVEQQKGFKVVAGTLKLTPDAKARQAVLAGAVRLEGEPTDSRVEGTFQAVLGYDPDSPELRSARGFVEGTFHYRVHGRERGESKIEAALELTP